MPLKGQAISTNKLLHKKGYISMGNVLGWFTKLNLMSVHACSYKSAQRKNKQKKKQRQIIVSLASLNY